MEKRIIPILILALVSIWMFSCYKTLAGIARSVDEISELQGPYYQYSENVDVAVEEETEEKEDTISLISHIVTVTVYNAVPEQTNGNPLVTADRSKIDLEKLNNGTLRWCAVSRDLLKTGGLRYGDKIKIESDDQRISGIWEVHDTMHKRYENYVDLLMPTHIRTGKWKNVKIIKEESI